MSHHVFRYPNIVVDLAVVYLENQTNKVGENRRASRLGLDGNHTVTSLWPDYGQTAVVLLGYVCRTKSEMSWSNVRDDVRACLKPCQRAIRKRAHLPAVPFQTERANNALEGLIASQSLDIHFSQAGRRSLQW